VLEQGDEPPNAEDVARFLADVMQDRMREVWNTAAGQVRPEALPVEVVTP